MTWLWGPAVAFALILLALFCPVRLEFQWSPMRFSLYWIGLRLDWDEPQGGNFRLWVINFSFAQPKETAAPTEVAAPTKIAAVKKAKKKPSKSKKRPWFRPISYDLIKKTWKAPCFNQLVKTLLDFVWRLRFSFRIRKVQGTIGALDYLNTGVLSGLLAGLPQGKKYDLKTSFTGEQNFMLTLNFDLWRFLASLIGWAFRFPYGSLRQLYKIWLHPARAK